MDLWQRAKLFAEEAAKKSQEISKEAAKRSQELTKGAAKFSQELVSETAKKSKEIAAEASKKADLIRIEALRKAGQIKTLAGEIEIPIPIAQLGQGTKGLLGAEGLEEGSKSLEDLERFGVTEQLREFVKGVTISTFKDFPMQDEPETTDVKPVSNVRQDLNEWQAKHATLVLSTVKEISKFRYELCPRYMRERKFWRIYFLLVNSYTAPYQKRYFEESKLNLSQEEQDIKDEEIQATMSTSNTEVKKSKSQNMTSSSSAAEHDLDVFLLGDLGSSDEGPDDGDDAFDDDFDKIENKVLDSDDDSEKNTSKLS